MDREATDLAGPLAVAEVNGAKLDQFFLRDCRFALHAHLAPSFIDNAEDRDLDEVEVGGGHVLQFGRMDVEAARDHHVVGAVEQATDVAGLHSIDDAFGRRLGVVPEVVICHSHLATISLGRTGLLSSSQICNCAKGSGWEPGTSLANHCRGPIIAIGSTSVWP
jgi:hypothetical protein